MATSKIRKKEVEMPRDNCCRWIFGDVKSGNATWCPHPAKFGQPWCADHRRIVYVVSRLPSSRVKQAPLPIPQ